MKHKAACQCGTLSISSADDPEFVIACNCRACQRRTGSVFGVGAYFRKDGVSIAGKSAEWSRKADSGRSLTNHFCTNCGSTVFWSLEMRPKLYGVAVGSMLSELPDPVRAIWTSEKHHWVSFPEEWPTFEFGTPEP